MRLLVHAWMVVALSGASVSQDAVTTLPDNYQVEFENALVRVTRVRYGPHAKLPAHTHTAFGTAYVYLNDSGPVAFKHVGAEYGAVTRKPTTARAYRLFRGIEEVHEVENLSALPSEFLRVEFKTDPVAPRTLRGVFLPPARVETGQVVEFDNAQVRISRLGALAGTTLELSRSAFPSLLISLSASDLGRASWIEASTPHRLRALPDQVREMLRFELKTAPREGE